MDKYDTQPLDLLTSREVSVRWTDPDILRIEVEGKVYERSIRDWVRLADSAEPNG